MTLFPTGITMKNHEKAQEYMSEGDYAKAINFYSLAIKNDSFNSKLYSSRAKAYYLNLKQQHPQESCEIPQAQWKKILDDCNLALNNDKLNYDAMFYSGLALVYGFKKIDRGMKLINESYEKSLTKSKNYKHFTLPQLIYNELLKVKNYKKKLELEEYLTTSDPFFNKLVYLLQQNYEKETSDLFSKDIKKNVLDYGLTKLAIQYNKEIRELIEMFELRYDQQHEAKDLSIEPPDFLCDPISFHLFHDPVITPSGHSYEKAWLFQHLTNHEYDPLTRQKLTKDQCYPNSILKACVEYYVNKEGK